MRELGVKKYFGNYDYFLEKSAELRASGVPVRAAEAEAGNSSPDLARNRRRARAQARNALAGRKKLAETRVADLEDRLATLEARRSELVAQLSGGGKVDFAAVNRTLSEIQKKIEQSLAEWETAAEELEAIRMENERIHQES